MKLSKINLNLASCFVFSFLVSCLIATFITTHSVCATTITKDQVQHIYGFKAEKGGIQGGAITKKYFIFADSWSAGNSNGTTTIRFFDRKTKKEYNVDSSLISQDFKHASTIYHEWGSSYAQVIDAGSGEWHCFSINAKKIVDDSKCGGKLDSPGGDSNDNTSSRQGWTKYGNYFFRAYGLSDNDNHIYVFDKNRNLIDDYKVSQDAMPGCEPEDVAVDGDEGVLYMMCDTKPGHEADYYKIDRAVFSKYISPGGGSEKRRAKNSAADKKDASDYEQEAYTPSVSTYDGVVETSFFGTMQDDSEGCGVYVTLDLIINILTIGIGISATIGIAISGITYLTSKGNVNKTTKAKRHIYEIVVGLAVYAGIWAFLTFLLPEFNPELKTCKTLSSKEIATRDAKNAAVRAENAKNVTNNATNNSTEQCLKNAAKVVKNQVCKLKTPAERISTTAKLLAGSQEAPNAKYRQAMNETGANSSGQCEVNGESSNTYVATVLLASGVDPNVPKGKAGNNTTNLYNYFSKSPKWKKIGNSPILSRDGDVVINPFPNGHTSITVKNNSGKRVTAHASYCQYYPFIADSLFDDYDGTPTVFRYIGK